MNAKCIPTSIPPVKLEMLAKKLNKRKIFSIIFNQKSAKSFAVLREF